MGPGEANGKFASDSHRNRISPLISSCEMDFHALKPSGIVCLGN